jgi:hypothetical protein
MQRTRFGIAVVVGLLLVWGAVAQEQPQLTTAHGMVDKADKEGVSIRTRGADGKFGKSVMLKVTGTTKITTVTAQTRAGKTVLVQKDTDVKDLQPKQAITVIYATIKEGPVLLAAVVQPAGK